MFYMKCGSPGGHSRQLKSRIGKLQAEEDRLRTAANTDSMLGIANRSSIVEILEHALKANGPLSVLIVDLDHFKQINDVFGHLAGDHALREVVTRMLAALRGSDTLGRFGGEEFLVVMHAPPSGAEEAAERLRARVCAEPIVLGDETKTVTVSVGVAHAKPDEAGKELLARADRALYRAKDGGRNRVEKAASSL